MIPRFHAARSMGIRTTPRRVALVCWVAACIAGASAQGQSEDTPLLVTPYGNTIAASVAIQAAASSGDVTVVAWTDFSSEHPVDSTDVRLYWQRIRGSTALGEPQPITSDSARPVGIVRVLPFSKRFLVLWNDARPGNAGTYGRWIDTSGVLGGPEFLLGNGMSLVTWQRRSDRVLLIWTGVGNTYCRVFTRDGDSVGATHTLGLSTLSQLVHFDDSSDDLITLWGSSIYKLDDDGTLTLATAIPFRHGDNFTLFADSSVGILRDSLFIAYRSITDSLPSRSVVLDELKSTADGTVRAVGRDSTGHYAVLYIETVPYPQGMCFCQHVYGHLISIPDSGPPDTSRYLGDVEFEDNIPGATYNIFPNGPDPIRASGCLGSGGVGVGVSWSMSVYHPRGDQYIDYGANGFFLDGTGAITMHRVSQRVNTGEIAKPMDLFPQSLINNCRAWPDPNSDPRLVSRNTHRTHEVNSGQLVEVVLPGGNAYVGNRPASYLTALRYAEANITSESDGVRLTWSERATKSSSPVFREGIWRHVAPDAIVDVSGFAPQTSHSSTWIDKHLPAQLRTSNGTFILDARAVGYPMGPSLYAELFAARHGFPGVYRLNHYSTAAALAFDPNRHVFVCVPPGDQHFGFDDTLGTAWAQYPSIEYPSDFDQVAATDSNGYAALKADQVTIVDGNTATRTFKLESPPVSAARQQFAFLRFYGRTLLSAYLTDDQDTMRFQLNDLESGQLVGQRLIPIHHRGTPSIFLNPVDSSIGCVWASNKGVFFTHVDKHLKPINWECRVSTTDSNTYDARAAFHHDTLWVIWSDYRHPVVSIYGRVVPLSTIGRGDSSGTDNQIPPDIGPPEDEDSVQDEQPTQLEVTPSPVINLAAVHFTLPSGTTSASIELLDIAGRSSGITPLDASAVARGTVTIDTHALDDGVYLIVLRAGTVMDIRRTMVIHR